jgi:hypothetical protein
MMNRKTVLGGGDHHDELPPNQGNEPSDTYLMSDSAKEG